MWFRYHRPERDAAMDHIHTAAQKLALSDAEEVSVCLTCPNTSRTFLRRKLTSVLSPCRRVGTSRS